MSGNSLRINSLQEQAIGRILSPAQFLRVLVSDSTVKILQLEDKDSFLVLLGRGIIDKFDDRYELDNSAGNVQDSVSKVISILSEGVRLILILDFDMISFNGDKFLCELHHQLVKMLILGKSPHTLRERLYVIPSSGDPVSNEILTSKLKEYHIPHHYPDDTKGLVLVEAIRN